MIELSGRDIVGASKITERQAKEFKMLVAAVDECGEAKVRLNLTDLDATSLWKRQTDYYAFISRPNLTVIVDPETAATIRSYAQLTNTKINYEVRELEVKPVEEDPIIEEKGTLYATHAKDVDVYTLPDGTKLKNCTVLDIGEFGMDTLSSIGNSALYVVRAMEKVAKQTYEKNRRLVVDFSGIDIFEGGSDLVVADALVDARRNHRGISIKVLGEDRGIAEYVLVGGRVKLDTTSKLRFYNMLRPNTVLRLNTYPSSARSDIAGRKGGGTVSGVVIVIFKGVSGEYVLYDEIPTQQLFLPKDLPLLGEVDPLGDTRVPRKRKVTELGIYGVCSGSNGHFGPVSKKVKYSVNDGNGNLVEMLEPEFVARGLDALGFEYDKELLALGRVLPPPQTRR